MFYRTSGVFLIGLMLIKCGMFLSDKSSYVHTQYKRLLFTRILVVKSSERFHNVLNPNKAQILFHFGKNRAYIYFLEYNVIKELSKQYFKAFGLSIKSTAYNIVYHEFS